VAEEERSALDWEGIATLVSVATPVVVAVVKTLAERRSRRLNRYQVAVAAGQPVAEVTPVLEEMVKHGVVDATGDADSPNTREYELRPQYKRRPEVA
jgi:hypothetical protein